MKSNSDTQQNAAATESNQPDQCKRKPSQKQLILEHLLSGRSITQAEAAKLYNCWRLADVIHRLKRDDGYKILTLDEPNRQRPGTHARYVLMSGPVTPIAA